MRFAPIMPIQAFERFGEVSDCWMALVQHLHRKEYFNFFRRKVERGDTVILDNGAYEQRLTSSDRLNFWVRNLKPSVMVLPDVPGDFVKTLRHSWDYLDKYGLPKGTEGMMVLQAEDSKLRQFEVAYETCPVKWVGFSRLTKSYNPWMVWPQQRDGFATHLRQEGMWRSELKHHALGMLSGLVEELANLKGFESCDSSAPIWRGLLGYSMTDKWPNYEFQVEAGPEASNWEMAEKNLSEVMEACHGEGGSRESAQMAR
jgi:hypothetical protein